MILLLILLIAIAFVGTGWVVRYLADLVGSDGYGTRTSVPRSHHPDPFDPGFRGRAA
ncbi:MAG: hypothetical protein ACXVWU_11465 [Nocardioides sp.]